MLLYDNTPNNYRMSYPVAFSRSVFAHVMTTYIGGHTAWIREANNLSFEYGVNDDYEYAPNIQMSAIFIGV